MLEPLASIDAFAVDSGAGQVVSLPVGAVATLATAVDHYAANTPARPSLISGSPPRSAPPQVHAEPKHIYFGDVQFSRAATPILAGVDTPAIESGSILRLRGTHIAGDGAFRPNLPRAQP